MASDAVEVAVLGTHIILPRTKIASLGCFDAFEFYIWAKVEGKMVDDFEFLYGSEYVLKCELLHDDDVPHSYDEFARGLRRINLMEPSYTIGSTLQRVPSNIIVVELRTVDGGFVETPGEKPWTLGATDFNSLDDLYADIAGKSYTLDELYGVEAFFRTRVSCLRAEEEEIAKLAPTTVKEFFLMVTKVEVVLPFG